MKFISDGHLFRFCGNNLITIVTPYGDKHAIILNHSIDIPFTIITISKRDINKDHEQLAFLRELQSEKAP